ncbi:hypothetical protein HDU76_000544 [Blyttiomyces sp. JEL0837]|nr:hypothetical protein HDU76_000544 [Blyttiomyces sp. JEL0837]
MAAIASSSFFPSMVTAASDFESIQNGSTTHSSRSGMEPRTQHPKDMSFNNIARRGSAPTSSAKPAGMASDSSGQSGESDEPFGFSTPRGSIPPSRLASRSPSGDPSFRPASALGRDVPRSNSRDPWGSSAKKSSALRSSMTVDSSDPDLDKMKPLDDAIERLERELESDINDLSFDISMDGGQVAGASRNGDSRQNRILHDVTDEDEYEMDAVNYDLDDLSMSDELSDFHSADFVYRGRPRASSAFAASPTFQHLSEAKGGGSMGIISGMSSQERRKSFVPIKSKESENRDGFSKATSPNKVEEGFGSRTIPAASGDKNIVYQFSKDTLRSRSPSRTLIPDPGLAYSSRSELRERPTLSPDYHIRSRSPSITGNSPRASLTYREATSSNTGRGHSQRSASKTRSQSTVESPRFFASQQSAVTSSQPDLARGTSRERTQRSPLVSAPTPPVTVQSEGNQSGGRARSRSIVESPTFTSREDSIFDQSQYVPDENEFKKPPPVSRIPVSPQFQTKTIPNSDTSTRGRSQSTVERPKFGSWDMGKKITAASTTMGQSQPSLESSNMNRRQRSPQLSPASQRSMSPMRSDGRAVSPAVSRVKRYEGIEETSPPRKFAEISPTEVKASDNGGYFAGNDIREDLGGDGVGSRQQINILPIPTASSSSSRQPIVPVERSQRPIDVLSDHGSASSLDISFAKPSHQQQQQFQNETSASKQNIQTTQQKPPLPPSIKTRTVRSLNDLSSVTTTHFSQSATSASPGQQSASSLYANVPNLADLADPRKKGSVLNLVEQGPAMIPSVVDRIEGVKHMGLTHLPEDNNSRAVVNALRTLQDKVSRLEFEKSNAKNKIHELQTDLTQTKHLLYHEQSRNQSAAPSIASSSPMMPPAKLIPEVNPRTPTTATTNQPRAAETAQAEETARVRALEIELAATKRALELEQQIAAANLEAVELAKQAKRQAAKTEEMLKKQESERDRESSAVLAAVEMKAREELAKMERIVEERVRREAVEAIRLERIAEEMARREAEEAVRRLEERSRVEAEEAQRRLKEMARREVELAEKRIEAKLRGKGEDSYQGRRLNAKGRRVSAAPTDMAVDGSAESLSSVKEQDEEVPTPFLKSSASQTGAFVQTDGFDVYSRTAPTVESTKSPSVDVNLGPIIREKQDLEEQLESLRGRTHIMERQLDRMRSLQGATATERNLAQQELASLRSKIISNNKHHDKVTEEQRERGRKVARAVERSKSKSRSGTPSRSISPTRMKYGEIGGLDAITQGSDAGKGYKQKESGLEESKEDTGDDGDVDDVAFLKDGYQHLHQHQHQHPQRGHHVHGEEKGKQRSRSHSPQVQAQSQNESFLGMDEIERLRMEIELLRAQATKRTQSHEDGRGGGGSPVKNQTPPRSKMASPVVVSDKPEWKKVDGSSPNRRKHSLGSAVSSPDRPKGSYYGEKVEKHNRSRSRPSSRNAASAEEGNFVKAMPFVVGQNTQKSYSVTANLQRVFSLLKSHNPALCSVCSKRKRSSPSLEPDRQHFHSTFEDRTHRHQREQHLYQRHLHRLNQRREGGGKEKEEQDHAIHHREIKEEISGTKGGLPKLKEVLVLLEDDFEECKRNYYDLVKQYEDLAEETGKGSLIWSNSRAVQDASIRLRDIGDALVDVIQNMEIKGDQISILREIIATSTEHSHRSHPNDSGAKPESTKRNPSVDGRKSAANTTTTTRSQVNSRSATAVDRKFSSSLSSNSTSTNTRPGRGSSMSRRGESERDQSSQRFSNRDGGKGTSRKDTDANVNTKQRSVSRTRSKSRERRSRSGTRRVVESVSPQRPQRDRDFGSYGSGSMRGMSLSRSPSRALASLTLLKSSMKVQEALGRMG